MIIKKKPRLQLATAVFRPRHKRHVSCAPPYISEIKTQMRNIPREPSQYFQSLMYVLAHKTRVSTIAHVINALASMPTLAAHSFLIGSDNDTGNTKRRQLDRSLSCRIKLNGYGPVAHYHTVFLPDRVCGVYVGIRDVVLPSIE